MRKLIVIIAAFAVCVGALAATITNNLGQVIEVETLQEQADAFQTRTDDEQDRSVYPNLYGGDPRGIVYRRYKFGDDGGAAGTVTLNAGTEEDIPGGFCVTKAIAYVHTAILPITATTNSIGINTTTDVMPVGTTLATTGAHMLYSPTNAPIVVTNDLPAVLTITTGSATQGVFDLVLYGVQLFKLP